MRTLPLFIAIIFCKCSYAQLFNNITSFTTQQGLSNNTINCLQKDSSGFLWIGTHEGLNRYDGTEFVNILSNSKNDLPSNNINKICFINGTLLAVATDNGLCLLNTLTLKGNTITLPYLANFPGTGYGISDIFYKRSTKELWVSTWHGLFVLNTKGILLKKMMAQPGDIAKGYFARHLLNGPKDDIYFYSQQKACFCYPDFTNQKVIPVEEKVPGLIMNNFTGENSALMGLHLLEHEAIFIFSKITATSREEYLFYYNNESGKHFTDKLPLPNTSEKRMAAPFMLNDSMFIINSYFGEPFLYNHNNHTITAAADHPLWFTSWPDGLGATIYKDANDTWIATSKGLLQSSLKTNFFKNNTTLVNKINESNSLVSYNYGIYHDQKLWVSCLGAGLYGLDTTHNTVVNIFDNNTTGAFSKKRICTEIIEVGKNTLWLFSIYGPAMVNTLTNQLSVIHGIDVDSSFNNSAGFPLKDYTGNIWTTLPDGIADYTVADNKFTNYKSKYFGGEFPVLRAGPKAEDNKGNLWFGRQDTIVKRDAASGAFTVLLLRKNGKPIRSITLMACDGDDILYLGVAGSLGIYHISSKTIDLFTKQTGIISTVINDIVSDKNGNAWIATEGGLIFYNKQKKKFSSFTKADGLPGDNVISLNFTDASKRTLFLGFEKNYCLFEPQHFLLEKTVPKNFITGIEVNGGSLLTTSNPVLSYEQNSISFTYTGINFNQGQQNNYACMLDGFDHDWKYTGTERKINYINLPPGTYTFKVKTANHQGEWNEVPAIFLFEITPPFWQRWWFRVLLACLVIFGIYYFIKRREASFQKENQLKLQMSELRMQALRAQMNPHFIFNSLNSIQNYILSNNTIDAAGYLSKFAKLMRRILDQSKHNFLPLGEVMDTLKLYVEIEAFRFNNEFSFHFDIEDNDDLLDASLPPMLLQPFVENAILHGLMPKAGDKKLEISCHIVDKNVVISIDDNGIGRTQHKPKAGHTSQGEKLTAGMLESLQLMKNSKASIDIIDNTDNGIPTGTTIKLVLPLN